MFDGQIRKTFPPEELLRIKSRITKNYAAVETGVRRWLEKKDRYKTCLGDRTDWIPCDLDYEVSG